MRFYDVLRALVGPAAPGFPKARRAGWKNVSYIAVQWPDKLSVNTRPYLYGVDPEGQRVPWLASQVDLFADDWELD